MACAACPCQDICTGGATYCRWAAATPPEPLLLRHICDASRAKRQRPATDPATDTSHIDAVLAAAKQEMGDASIRTEPRTGCCG